MVLQLICYHYSGVHAAATRAIAAASRRMGWRSGASSPGGQRDKDVVIANGQVVIANGYSQWICNCYLLCYYNHPVTTTNMIFMTDAWLNVLQPDRATSIGDKTKIPFWRTREPEHVIMTNTYAVCDWYDAVSDVITNMLCYMLWCYN